VPVGRLPSRPPPRLCVGLIRCLVARLDDAYVGAQADAQAPPAPRIVHTLRCVARPYRLRGTDAMHPLAVRLSHADVARLVGADRTTVTRLLGSLAAQGLVQRERSHITSVAAAWRASWWT
jgi:CRP-like cAMP-binding protein